MPFLIAAIPAIGTAIAGVGAAVGAAAAGVAGALGVGVLGQLAVEAAVTAAFPAVLEFGALAGASALLTPKPKVNTAGSPQAFKADPNAPIPVVMGRYGVGGNLVYETTSGGSNKAEHGAQGNEYLTHFTILSGLGPIEGVETLRFDDTILTFSGETCSGGYIPQAEVQSYNPGYTQIGSGAYAGSYQNNVFANHAWQSLTNGGIPNPTFNPPAKLAQDSGALTEWTGKGFSGFAASALTIVYDQTVYTGGVPQRQWVLKGHHTYDPRHDNNYPGGSGNQYWAGAGAAHDTLLNARNSWTWSENAILHALNYALGYYLPDGATGLGRHYLGIGAGGPGVAGQLGGVDVAAFVHAANVADANGWKICGQWTSQDGKWSVLTAMLQAGGAVPFYDRGRISCMISEPRVSLGTVTANDLAGEITLDTGTSRRERPNTVFYKYSSEAHRWQVVQADTPISPATYVAEDGEVRVGTPLTLEYVPSVDQAAQLTAYAIADAREIPNITLIGKPHLRAYAVGDCLTADIPEAGLATTKLVVTKRTTSISTGQVTLVCRTETDAKHAYALGRTGVAPATPGISGIDPSIVPAPIPASWTAVPVALPDTATGSITHVIRINGSTIDNVFAGAVVVEYALVTTVGGVDTLGPIKQQSFEASVETIDLSLPPGRYHVWIRYRTVSGAENVDNSLDLGVITVAGNTVANTVNVGTKTAAELISDVDGLIASYGSTGSAAGSAADAEAAAANALAYKNAAQSASSDALGYRNAASGSADTASSKAGEAGGYASAAHADRLAADASAGAASGSAGVAATQAAAASASQAAAQTSASVAARVGYATLNKNPTFALYPDADAATFPGQNTGDASGWFDNSYAWRGASRVVGQDSPYAYRVNDAAADAGVVLASNQDASGPAFSPGWYVFEAHITLNSGTLANAGVSVAVAVSNGGAYLGGDVLRFWSDPDTGGVVQGAGAAGTTYRFSKLVDLRYPTGRWWTFYVFTNGIDAVGAARDITWHKAGIRPAYDQEIAAHKATGDIALVSAALTDEANARADGDGALASRVSTTEAKFNGQPNLVQNPSFAQGSSGWTLSNGVVAGGNGSDVDGPYVVNFSVPDNTTTYFRLAEQLIYGIEAGVGHSLQVKFFSDAIAAPTTFLRCVVVWENASNGSLGEVELQTNARAGWTNFKLNGTDDARLTPPTSTHHARVVLDLVTSSGNIRSTGGAAAATRVKLEMSPVCSVFSDERLSAAVQVTQQALAAPGIAAAALGLQVTADAGTGHPKVSGLRVVAADGSVSVSAVLIDTDNFVVKTPSGAELTFGDAPGEPGVLTVPALRVLTGNIGEAQVSENIILSAPGPWTYSPGSGGYYG